MIHLIKLTMLLILFYGFGMLLLSFEIAACLEETFGLGARMALGLDRIFSTDAALVLANIRTGRLQILRRLSRFMVRNTIYYLIDVANAEPSSCTCFQGKWANHGFQSYTSQKDVARSSTGAKEIALCGDRKRNRQRVVCNVKRIDYREGWARSVSYCRWTMVRRGDYDTEATNDASQVPSGKHMFGIDSSAKR